MYASEQDDGPPTGIVFLVGAGPGDTGLLTIRGKQCLEDADVVLFDGLANHQLLDFAEDAEHISVGKHGKSPIWTQAKINQKMLELARAGKTVVRLKGGDPAVFARTAEELEVLSQAGIAFEVVPGITAALAAASYVGIPITHRRHASAVAFITGQQQSDEAPLPINWKALANFPGTLVFYMGVTTASTWTQNLVNAGLSPETPAAIIRRCTWPDQKVIRCALKSVAKELTPANKLRPPVIVILGEVAALGEDFDWVSTRLLHGCGVLVTRPKGQTDELSADLQRLGADVHSQPAIEIVRPQDLSTLDAAIDRLAGDDNASGGVTFSSVNGVQGLMDRAMERGFDARLFQGRRLAVVGSTTGHALRAYGLIPDVIPAQPSGFNAQGLVDALGESVEGEDWIVTHTNKSQDTLAQGLEAAGARVTRALAYESRPASLKLEIAQALEQERLQYCLLTSSASAEAMSAMLGEYRDRLRPISISAQVTERLEALHWGPVTTADESTSDSPIEKLVSALLRAVSDHKNG